MVWLVRPLLEKALRSRPAPTVLVWPFCGMCLSSFVTDAIGVHALFGAFTFGVAAPIADIPSSRL